MEARSHKTIIEIDLKNKVAVKKISGDLRETVGGIVTGYKLFYEYFEEKPLIITSGPLSGYFPYVSKSIALFESGRNVKELIGGGSIASKMNMAGIDALVFTGIASFSGNLNVDIFENDINISDSLNEVSRKTSFGDLFISKSQLLSQGYFSFGKLSENYISENEINIRLNIEYSEDLEIKNVYDYEKLYKKILDSYRELTVDPANNPSCFGCPIGCERSSEGEEDLNISILPRCLVSCGYAASIYKHIPVVFACLQSIGYDYTHNDLEQLPALFSRIKESIGSLYQLKR